MSRLWLAPQAARGIYELLGRYYRVWTPDDAADATADHIPLAERLKQYERERQMNHTVARAGQARREKAGLHVACAT